MNQHFSLSFEKGGGCYNLSCIKCAIVIYICHCVIRVVNVDNCTDAKHCVEFSVDVYHYWIAMSEWFYCIICTPQKHNASKFEEIVIYIYI